MYFKVDIFRLTLEPCSTTSTMGYTGMYYKYYWEILIRSTQKGPVGLTWKSCLLDSLFSNPLAFLSFYFRAPLFRRSYVNACIVLIHTYTNTPRNITQQKRNVCVCVCVCVNVLVWSSNPLEEWNLAGITHSRCLLTTKVLLHLLLLLLPLDGWGMQDDDDVFH